MKWSTTVIFPPDGDMADYMASLEKLRRRSDRIYYPAHGPAVDNPQQYVRQLVGHRMQRESQILSLTRERPRKIAEIVVDAYPGLDPRLIVAAGGSVLAHLIDLQKRGLVDCLGELWGATVERS
jgi:glyoxylase-like metal-dependent hydrolase (beta-lactamase superfamily II)